MENNIFFFGDTAYVAKEFLKDYNVKDSTIWNHTSGKGKQKKWYTTKHPSNKKNIIISFDSFDEKFLKEFNIPSLDVLRAIYQKNHPSNNGINFNGGHIKIILDLEYYGWVILKELYKNEFLGGKTLEQLCKTHAVLSRIIELNELNYSLKELFPYYCQYDDLVFTTNSYHSFCNKIKEIKQSQSIEDVLIHGLAGLPSNNLKLKEDVIIEILRLFSKPKKLNARLILVEVNEYLIKTNRDEISISAVYSVISQNYIQNKFMISRFGYSYTRNHLIPYAHFDPPQSEGILWLMDGTKFQFAYLSDDGKIRFLTFFVIMDGKTKEIIAYSCDVSENSFMVKRALERACSKTKYLPLEIISDNSSAFKGEEMERFQSLIKIWGIYWHKINRSNSRDNAYVERFFGVFQESFCKKYDGYIGDGIRSRNLNGKPSNEEIKEYLKDKNLRSKTQVIELLNGLINEYNQSKKRLALINADAKILKNIPEKKLHPLYFENHNYEQLFWKHKEIKIDGGVLSFDYNKSKYKYNLEEKTDILLRLNRKKVQVMFDPKNLSKILLYDLKTDEFIIDLHEDNHGSKAMAERTEENHRKMQEHLRNLKKIESDLEKGVEEIQRKSDKNRQNLPKEIAALGIGEKSEIEEAERAIITEDDEQSTYRIQKKFNKQKTKNKTPDRFENLFFGNGNLTIIKNGKN